MTKICFLVILFVCIFTTSGSANWQKSDIEGQWVNVDSRTRGITTLVISKRGPGWGIEAFGKCHPRDCVWGSVVLAPIGDSVSDTSFDRGFAIWHADFVTKYVTVSLENDRLTAEVYTIFTDYSGLSNNRFVGIFNRGDEQLTE